MPSLFLSLSGQNKIQPLASRFGRSYPVPTIRQPGGKFQGQRDGRAHFCRIHPAVDSAEDRSPTAPVLLPLPATLEEAPSKRFRSEERRVGKGGVSTCRYRGSPDA